MTYFTQRAAASTPIIPLNASQFPNWLKAQPAAVKQWFKTNQYTHRVDSLVVVPDGKGGIACAMVGVDAAPHIWSIAFLPALLPAGTYRIEGEFTTAQLADMALGFALGQYQFGTYKKLERKAITLVLPKSAKPDAVERRVAAYTLVRDLINTAPADMGPEQLAKAAQAVAKAHGATFEQIVGDALLKKNYPAIHAVGRAAPQAPRLIRLQWGNPKHKRVALVGKGVTFDTGGLDLKPLAAMRLMKKDMGGAALVLGLAQLIMQEKLPVYLDVLIPAVENSIDGNAFRPSDIVPTRKGLSIEIGSTDAEGRVILADALAEADAGKPDLMIDVATLTGAARTALGTELPALYSNRDAVAQAIQQTGMRLRDPLWHMPLWQGYAKYVNSPVADIANSPNYGFAGSVTAALFLERFVSPGTEWVHIDSYAWNAEAQPGRPVGGEALCLRALYAYLTERYTAARK
ncbi:MAG: leucyl aminopeptidase [Azospirillum brasilense]|nr:MAG: leucyl aminopeptidase [Azospirillum brasilense]